ncbi:hypothetical protein [Corynebacterium coyleae]|uniref:hypothetical protein n=1 Tax=Corynebacterium coyleae TaxID=53374 RepID=UPI0011AEB25F|nr:hypothetical protein [Corynebacterium coyleae]
MRFSTKVMAVGLCAALAPVCVVPAQAKVTQQGRQVVVEGQRKSTWSPYINATVRPDGHGLFDFDHPEAAAEVLKYGLSTDVYVNEAKMPVDWNATPETLSRDDGTDTVVYTQTFNGVEVKRTINIFDNIIQYTVTATNVSGAPVNVRVEAVSDIMGNHGQLRAQQYFDGEIRVSPEKPGHTVRVKFANAGFGVGPTAEKAKESRNDNDARFQAGRWSKSLAAGEKLEAETQARFIPQPAAFDSDGDGLRNSWERVGMKLSSGKSLPIHQWGADENKPDLFLQLHWMRSEWEQLKCDRKESFAASVEGFTQFADCARANTKDYAPSPEILKQLEERFAKQGINLHIVAGPEYVSSSMSSMKEADREGGKTEDYAKEFMPGLADPKLAKDEWAYALYAQNQFISARERLLGERKAVFRVGVIGDTISRGDSSTGLALVNDSVFFVANHPEMTTQEQLRNTILHEFGHTLNLLHYGAHVESNTAPARDDLEEYNSVMSYAHQFNQFNFAEKETHGHDETGREFQIPADWANLNLPGANVGQGHIGVNDETDKENDKDDHDHDHSHGEESMPVLTEGDVKELVINAASNNKYKAGFRLNETANGDNGVVAQLGDDNVLRGTISNLGDVDERFKVSVNYGSGVFQQSYDLKPAGKVGDEKQVDIKLDRAAFLDKPVVPLSVVVTNSRGTEVFSQSYNVSALNYTREEMAKVLAEVLASDAPEYVKDMARRKLQPKDKTEGTSNAPAAQKPKTQQPPANGDGAVSPVAIIIGVLLAIGGLGAALAGWAMSQGMI